MKIYRSIEKFINSKLQVQSFIPTMGNLHQGHLSLITKAKKKFWKYLCKFIRK